MEILKISKFKGNFSFVKQQSRDLSQNDLFCTDDSMLGKKVHIWTENYWYFNKKDDFENRLFLMWIL